MTLYKLLKSHPVLALEAILGVFSFSYQILDIVVYPLLIVMILNCVFYRDLTPSFAPFVIISMSTICHYGATFDQFLGYVWILALALVAFVAHFIIYPPKFIKGGMYWSLIAVSMALLFAGLGATSFGEYFSGTNLYYTLCLGPLMVFVYFIFLNTVVKDKNHDPAATLARSMCYIGGMAAIVVLVHLLPPMVEGELPYFQWKNNISNFLLFAIPFPFFFAVKAKSMLVSCFSLLLGFGFGLCCVLSLSRGGMICGVVATVLSTVYAFVACRDIHKRFVFSVLFIGGLILIFAIGMIFADFFGQFLGKLSIDENEARVELYDLAVENFLRHPFFGRGMGYKGIPSIYSPVNSSAMFWYHSTPFQIIGSMGVVGIIAYGFQYMNRTFVLLRHQSEFNWCVFLSFLAFELMAIVNPGDFSPIPFGIILLFILTVGEINAKKVNSPSIPFCCS